jgi:hypothetical protein
VGQVTDLPSRLKPASVTTIVVTDSIIVSILSTISTFSVTTIVVTEERRKSLRPSVVRLPPRAPTSSPWGYPPMKASGKR